MRAIKSANTGPELALRRALFGLGLRYRLHGASLPGKPDLVFPGRKAVVFVHGCFWHGHDCRRGNRVPKTNEAYWRAKIERNRTRDANHRSALELKGWRVLYIWECALRDPAREAIACALWLNNHGAQ